MTSSEARWPVGYHGLPERLGQLREPTKYDASFFGVGKAQAGALDPQIRMLLEVVYEAITDAGYSMADLVGSNTGVYIGGCFSDLHKAMLTNMTAGDGTGISGYENTGCCFTMFANRVSFHFDFHGPSLSIDTACSSSLVAMDQAVRDLRSGRITRAIVGGVSLCTDPTVSKAFQQYSMLSPSGKCHSFDDRADGYVRADGIGAVLLELAESSGGVHGVCCGLMEVLGTGTNCDGFKEKGITFPSASQQANLFESVFASNGLDATTVGYIEAHGTGTVAGDGVELTSIEQVFCGARESPVLVGSVKSNMGHAEGASGMMAVAKVAGILTEGNVPGNLHFQSSLNHPQLQSGVIAVVNTQQAVDMSVTSERGLVVVNNFGFGGTNAVLVGRSGGAHLNTDTEAARYIFGRTCEAVEKYVDDGTLNRAAWDKMMRSSTALAKFPWRGVVTPAVGPDDTDINSVETNEIQLGPLGRVPVAFCYSGQGCQWNGMGRQLYRHNALFRVTIDDACVGLPLHTRYTDTAAAYSRNDPEPTAVTSIGQLFEGGDLWMDRHWSGLGITLVQIGLTAVLRDAGVVPDYIFGHSVGEVACGYADGCTSAREAARIAYVRCDCAINATGLMLAAGLSHAAAQQLIAECSLQTAVIVACNNSPDGVTLSGSSDAIQEIKALLDERSVFARVVPTGGIAYHSLFFKQNSAKIEQILGDAIRQSRAESGVTAQPPIARSSKWLSTSSHAGATTYADEVYHMGNCTGMVDFAPVVASLPAGTVVVEVGPHSLLKSVLARGNPGITSISCMTRLDAETLASDSSGDGTNSPELGNLQQCLDSLWLSGASFEFPKYHHIVPMAHRVPMLWDHSADWRIARYQDFEASATAGIRVSYDLFGDDSFLLDHRIDGKALFPATGHIVTAWRAFNGGDAGVSVFDLKILRAVLLSAGESDTGEVWFTVQFGSEGTSVGTGTGTGTVVGDTRSFAILHNEEQVACGRISNTMEVHTGALTRLSSTNIHVPDAAASASPVGVIQGAEVYTQFRRCGYEYGHAFRLIEQRHLVLDGDGGCECRFGSTKHWIAYLDNLLQAYIGGPLALSLPTEIGVVQICVTECAKLTDPVVVSPSLGAVGSPQAAIYRLKTSPMSKSSGKPIIIQTDDVLERLHSGRTAGSGTDSGAICVRTTEFVPYGRRLVPSTAAMNSDAGKDVYIRNCLYLVSEILRDNLPGVYNVVQLAGAAVAANDKHTDKQQWSLTNLQSVDWVSSQSAAVNIPTPVDTDSDTDSAADSAVETLGDSLRSRTTPLLYEYMHSKLAHCFSGVLVHTADTEDTGSSAAVAEADLCILDCESLSLQHVSLLSWIQHEVLKASGFLLMQCIPAQLHTSVHACLAQCGYEVVLDYILPCDGTERSLAGPDISDTLLLLAYKPAAPAIAPPSELDGSSTSEQSTPTEQLITTRHAIAIDSHQLLVTSDFGHYGFTRSLRQEPPSGSYEGLRVCVLPAATATMNKDGVEAVNCEDVLNYAQVECKSALPMHAYQRQRSLPGGGSDTEGFRCVLGGYHQLLPSHHHIEGLANTDQSLGASHEAGHHVEVGTPGDLTSLHWVPSRSSGSPMAGSRDECLVSYCGINFKDVMLAYGKLKHVPAPGSGSDGVCLGLEFSGCDRYTGRSVFGVSQAGCLATSVRAPVHLTWPLPTHMTLEQACTVPVVYSTAYYALVVKACIRRAQTVLIHSVAGGVGQAALNICRHRGCRVIATCSKDKREWVHTTLGLPLDHILDSHATSFRDDVMLLTRGEGVNVVLNSLSDTKLQASLECVARYGHFCEIGKYDIQQNTAIGLGVFERNISFHAFDLADIMFSSGSFDDTSKCYNGVTDIWHRIHTLVTEGLASGEILPLSTTVFDTVPPALKCISGGKHKGKVLVRLHPEGALALANTFQGDFSAYETAIVGRSELPKHPRFSTTGVHLVVGGLGGFGLELVHWLYSHGAEKVVVVSRGNPKAHQLQRLRGGRTVISHVDLGNAAACDSLCQLYGAELIGIWHLGMVLNDCLYANMTEQAWDETVRVKATIATNLDTTSRVHNPCLEQFVMWSSVSSLFGNPGQTNYAYANGAMEGVVMRRKQSGLCGLAIQWVSGIVLLSVYFVFFI